MKLLTDTLILHVRIILKGMTEKQRRLYLASLAIALGYGGISALSRAIGVSRAAYSGEFPK